MLTILTRLLPPSISIFFRMEIFHIPVYTLTRTQGEVSNLQRSLLCPFKPGPRCCREEADGIRDEEDVSSANGQAVPSDGGHAHMRGPLHSTQDNQMEEDSLPKLHVPKLKYIATPQKVHDSFDAVNNLHSLSPPISLVRIQKHLLRNSLNLYFLRTVSGFNV